MSASPFTPGDIVVYRVGSGSATLSGSATGVFLDEYTTAGTLVQSIPLSTSGAAALTASGTASSEGQLTLSPDGSTIALTGYDVATGGTTQGNDNGTVALVGASATPTYYVLPSSSVVNGNNIRSATVDGNNLYVAGAATSIQYANLSSLTSGGLVNAATTQLNTTAKNIEQVHIFNGQVYFSTQKQSIYNIANDSIASMGTGEPTATSTPAGVADTSTSSFSFFFEHLGAGTGAPNTLYVADSSIGIEKYSLVGSTWTAKGTAPISGGAFGITGSVDGSGHVDVVATNSSGVYTITDASGQSGTLSGTGTKIISAATNTIIDGVVLAPAGNVIGPPINTVPGAQGVVENNSLLFSPAGGNPVSIADSAVGSTAVQIALSVAHGTLTLSGTAGLTFAARGNAQASFTATGTLANINAALNGLTYTPTNGYTGADLLHLVTSDLGNTTLGTPQIASSTVTLTVAAAPPVLLNEIEANDPGTADNRYQYVELIGTPGAALSNAYFVAFDGAAGNTGNADLVVNLSGFSLGSDGLLVIQSSATSGHSILAATTLVSDSAFFTQTGGFLNGSLSFFLYDCPNAPFIAGTDYDTNDDGALDHVPAGSVDIDNVAIPDTNNPSDIVYGNVEVTELASLNKGTADAVTRFPGTSTTASNSWFGGELVDTNNVDSQLVYDPTRKAANEPANAVLTPGAVNFAPPPLNLTGPAFYLKLDADQLHLDIWTSTTAIGAFNQQALLTNIQTVNIQGTGGASSVTVDFSAGDPLPYGGLNDTGDNLLVIGSPGNDVVTASTGQIIIDRQTLSTTNVSQLAFTPGDGTDSLSVQSGQLLLSPPVHANSITAMTFSNITLAAGARLTVQTPSTPATRSVVVTSNLTLAQSSTLDLTANDLIVRSGNLSTVNAYTQSNITSSTASADSTHLTTLGVIQNSVDGTLTGAPSTPAAQLWAHSTASTL